MHDDYSAILGMLLDDVAATAFVQPLMQESKSELIGDEFFMSIPPRGIAFVASFDGRVSAIQFFAEGHQQYKQFAGSLPEGVCFDDSRSSIQGRMGRPHASGGGKVIQFLGNARKWDRFDRQSYSLHIQYADDQTSISLVSLMRPDSVPR